jgi:nephrocystin-3
MGDTDQAAAAEPSAASRQIRVFLSSTFRDFMEERDLLVKQVFPELRRKARERGVEVVDVDLRWGITEEESRQGKVIPICLGEIDRCRPYFVGMLGERYGWIPPSDQYSPDVIERQPWLNDHLGGVSVTELEILHGVLNDPSMAGRAFFYFRDPAWSVSQGEPGFVCETQEEEAKLADLKQRVRTSGFPVAENIPDPKALADQIGSDLWELIEQQYPDRDEPDALEREKRQHASYQHSRLGIYLGGKRSINQLERWIDAGQQKILITGESGSGKSALIANWIETHKQNHPEDVVFAHHLGCTNDASAIRPLLARLIETAKQQLPEVYGYSLSVPQDWWELVAKAIEALQSLGRWAQQNNHRWIWVLDGLDRLAPDDQKALPWLPLTIPDGVVFMASALECPAREILLQRKYKTHTIAPLKAKDQDALIKQYLGRYTKQLIAELRQTILIHPLAGSPLFLRVLLEELRQCGRYETLAEQLTGYLSAKTVDDLYERVLERLESDGNGENVRKVMTALWASRAGLSEEELLAITGLKPLKWAPIDLALEEALGRNGNRLVFDHDYLRKAVEDRYLPTEKRRRDAHSVLADWSGDQDGWDARKAEEMPWQLLYSERYSDLTRELVEPPGLIAILEYRDEVEYAILFQGSKAENELLTKEVGSLLSSGHSQLTASVLDSISALLEFLDTSANILLECRFAWVASCEVEGAPIDDLTRAKQCLANSLKDNGRVTEAINLYSDLVETAKEQPMPNEQHACALEGMAVSFAAANDYIQAEALFRESINERLSLYGRSHPISITVLSNFAVIVLADTDRIDEAIEIMEQNYQQEALLYGADSLECAIAANNMSMALYYAGKDARALDLARTASSSLSNYLPSWSDKSLIASNNLSAALLSLGNENEALEHLHGSLALASHNGNPDIIAALCQNIWDNYSPRFLDFSRIKEIYKECLQACMNCRRIEHRVHQRAYLELATLAQALDDSQTAEKAYLGLIALSQNTSEESQCEALYVYAKYLSEESRRAESIDVRRRELLIRGRFYGYEDSDLLISLNELAIDLREIGELQEAESLFRELVTARQQVLEPEDFQIGRALGGLAKTLEAAGKLEEALTYSQRTLDHRLTNEGPDAWWTNLERLDLARVLHKLDRSAEALNLLDQLHESMAKLQEPDEGDLQLVVDAKELQKSIRSEDQ